MDSTKLKQFLLLREFEQQQITINHDKLQTLDSERKPNIIFESDGFKSIERRGSSTASSDSGFPISPSTPPCVNSKTPKSGTRVPPNFPTDNDPNDRSDDELDIPPLPASRPPEDLERPFSPEALVTLHSDKKPQISLAPENSRELDESKTDSSCTSASESSDESDSCNHYVVTKDTSQQPRPKDHRLPFEISKLEGSVKSMRNKIRPGTVQNITTLFTNKARRIKRENKKRKRRPFPHNTDNGEHCTQNIQEKGSVILDLEQNDNGSEVVQQNSDSDSSSAGSEHDSEISDHLQRKQVLDSESSVSDSEDVPQFTFSAETLGQQKSHMKCGTNNDKADREKDEELFTVKTVRAKDQIVLENKDKQTISAELKRKDGTLKSYGEKNVDLHQSDQENGPVKEEIFTKARNDANETQPLPTQLQERNLFCKPDTNDKADGLVQEYVVRDINQNNKSESNILNYSAWVTQPESSVGDLDRDELPDIPDVHNKQETVSSSSSDNSESETADDQNSDDSTSMNTQFKDESKLLVPHSKDGSKVDYEDSVVEEQLLELQKAVERNNALLSQSLEENSKLLDLMDDDDSEINIDMHSNKRGTLPSAVNSKPNVSESVRYSESAETKGGYKSVINLKKSDKCERPKDKETNNNRDSSAGSHLETGKFTVQVVFETTSNAATCGALTDVSISDDSQCVPSDHSGSMNIDAKNSSSLNDSSVSAEFSFSSNSTNAERSESPGVEPASERTENEDCHLTESGYTASQKIFIHNPNPRTAKVGETEPHCAVLCNPGINQDDENEKTKVLQQECEDVNNEVCKSETPSFIKRNTSEQAGSDAWYARGPQHVTGVTANASTYTTPCQQVSDSNTHPSEQQHSPGVPEFYTLPGTFKTDKIVSLKELSGIARSMPDRYSGYTSSGSDSSSYTGGRKVRTKTTTLRSGRDSDRVGENVDLESNVHLKHLAETISKLNGENNDELLPEINQTVTKLPGGNLVITTLTHKIVEEEDDEKEISPPPDMEEDDRRCIIQDHKGNYYMVEDITDESQESAYYSSSMESHNASDGHRNNQNFKGIYNLQAVGKTGIDYDTAEEVLLGLYNPSGSMQIQEIDERTGEGHYLHERYHSGGQYGTMSSDSSHNRQMTSYDETDKVHRPVPQTVGSTSVKTVRHSYEMEGEEGEQEGGYRRCEAMQTSQSNADNAGMSNSNSSYMMESSAMMYPPVLPPPMIVPPPIAPVYHMAVVDVTPSPPKIEETREERREIVEVKPKDVERPIYKSVALVKGPYEAPKWQKQRKEFIPADIDDKRCVILNSKATEDKHEETVEEVTTKEYYTMKMSSGGVTENNFNDSSYMETGSPHRFKTEKVFLVNGTAPSPVMENQNSHRYNVMNESRPVHISESQHSQGYNIMHENRPVHISNDSRQKHSTKYHVRSDFERYHDNHPVRMEATPVQAEAYQTRSGSHEDIRVVRGNILIKNTLDQDLDEYNDNINLFDQAFNMTKENPLYHSDEDIYKRFEREREHDRSSSQRIQNSVNNDITFDTVDRFTKCKEGQYYTTSTPYKTQKTRFKYVNVPV